MGDGIFTAVILQREERDRKVEIGHKMKFHEVSVCNSLEIPLA